MKTFNTAGTCRPNEHYMVDITERLEIIRKMVAKGDYFCINRGRQYGKTTTLAALDDELKNDYCVFSISFEGLDDNAFASASNYHFFYEELYRIQDHCCPCNDKVYHPKPRHKHASLVPPSLQRTDRMLSPATASSPTSTSAPPPADNPFSPRFGGCDRLNLKVFFCLILLRN